MVCKKNFPAVTTLCHSNLKKLLEKWRIAFFGLKMRVVFLENFGSKSGPGS